MAGRIVRFAAIALVAAGGAGAQETDERRAAAEGEPGLSIELNRAETVEDACRLIFVIENELGADLDAAVFETVLFRDDGAVDRLTLFDFGALPQGRPRVRQFDVEGLACNDLGQVLFNGAATCEGAGIDAASCEAALTVRSRTEMEVLG